MPPPSYITDALPPPQLSQVAAQGFASGALRFGTISFASHFLLNRYTPVYRGLTIQFKVFLQISAMILGGCIFAEKSVGDFNEGIRRQRRAMDRSRRAWEEEREVREMVERRIAAEERVQRQKKGSGGQGDGDGVGGK
ncbi:uncharacterized protein Z520_10561 [Fonsecaea multimorphosa CBS 102226]|uniref:HIG1 domain-containing protein n=1 Tax=Fonsecaea multimorphosa CBS 102226 TaxID=1442371 RepID=A0A0D2GVL4_9EURO|nr:uncharacterized protein Z520_10561 [Fonsecaea multimorphosa CBS 102226]KIX93655.1 hypothetical protein Z520_10561 [Fonsecaea multimorphosa CBS 102226]OAL19768.1 hypothetical protein AYO22_09295 [Fonsecaea multimorphosa]